MILEVQISHTESIVGDVEVVNLCPIENNLRNIGTRTMGKDKVIMIIEVRFRKYKKDTHSMIHGACSNQEHR